MPQFRRLRPLARAAAVAALLTPAVACKGDAATEAKDKVDVAKDKVAAATAEAKDKVTDAKAEAKDKVDAARGAFYDWTTDTAHDVQCKVMDAMIGTHDGVVAPGSAGAPRWGIPARKPKKARVRRSWSTLSADEKRRVVDGFVALKKVTVGSGDKGSSRANYESLCAAAEQPAYERNLYDYYVEAHVNAFVSMGTPAEEHHSMSHMGPQFLPWHRYLLLRVEADLAEVLGDPEFTLPYWDWEECLRDGDPSACEPIFDRATLGSGGSCDDDRRAVEGYLSDQGFRLNLTTQGNNLFIPRSVVCGQTRPLHRQVGCNDLARAPADAAAVRAIFARKVYDAAPYDHCETDEAVSFRQYLEGYSMRSTAMTCTAVGCGMHSAGHIYIGGDMFESSGSPNDPMFFLHHANVDRLWAAWQAANVAAGRATAVDHGNPGYPEHSRGALFVWSEVKASEMFDHEALGYRYDALPTPE